MRIFLSVNFFDKNEMWPADIGNNSELLWQSSKKQRENAGYALAGPKKHDTMKKSLNYM